MNLFWKKQTIQFTIQTKDNKLFRFAVVEFEQKHDLNYFLTYFDRIGKDNRIYELIDKCISDLFKLNINLDDMYEGENQFIKIDNKKLDLINKHINNSWNIHYQPKCKEGKIRNIKIIHLVK